MKFLYTGKTAVITGAAGALGSAYAFELARRGCNVVINDIGSSLSGQLNNNEDPAGIIIVLSILSQLLIALFMYR